MHPFPPDPDSTADGGWVDDRALAELLDAERAPVARDLRRVVIRLDGGEDVEVGRTEGREQAVQLARETIAAIEAAAGRDEWPVVGDRHLRPASIVSVDVERAA